MKSSSILKLLLAHQTNALKTYYRMGNQIRPRSNSTSPVPSTSDEPSAKRARLLEIVTPTTPEPSRLHPGHKLYLPGAYLAPMVRIGTLPTRLLALEYGADLVWGPEIVDKAIIGSTRIVDESLIGSANKELALSAAQTVADDVSGIDLNCGCPKDFSLKGGMGAALLKEPDKLCGILIHLVQNLPTHPISVKIRLLPSQEETLSLVKKICETGVSCLTVHCRTQPMRSTEPALLHRLREIVDFIRPRSNSTSPVPSTSEEPSAKRARLLEIVTPTTPEPSRQHPGHKLYLPGAYLAPMVRIGTLPTRLLALEYGANLVWGPEIVDKAIIGSTRIVDETSGTIQYTKNNGTSSIWQTHPIEKSRLIYQIGSANKELALQAAQTVADDVSGIDLNCGCPKDFSLKGGMGAALLKEPDKLCGILIHLVQNLPTHPISVKIRLLPSQEETLSLVKKICETGVSCLTVHCRTQPMRSTEPALLHRLREIVDFVNQIRTSDNPLPVVANGDCYTLQDLPKFKELTGVTRAMIARGAESNVSCFRSDGLLNTIEEIMPRYIKAGLITRQGYPNAKYCLSTMDVKNEPKSGPNKNKFSRKELKTKIQQCKDWSQIAELFKIDVEETRQSNLNQLFPNITPFPTTSS
ncbi:hypothetical protein PSHT_13769 [Puccinia striiformis]|uniref:DUS-like FMN-binding domain-containing protein n=1 Tax=Puccinia striiformis TaxID=27350 RepID=A0A2S4UNP6_9BASI|nr:hypothetical protein PSHT_13769 [Puccinia striiformis]